MNKYFNWAELAIEKLNDEFCTGAFRPQNESDIQCHLYHTLFETKSQVKGITQNHLILSEFPFSASGEKFDLVIARQKKDNVETRLVIEIKETSQIHLTSNEVNARIKPDIEKLGRYKKWLQETEQMEIIKYYKKPIVFFFFRGASKHGIGVKTEREMKKLENYDDIILKFGPV